MNDVRATTGAAVLLLLEAELREELVDRPAVRADSLEALQRDLPRDLGMVRDERLVRNLRDDELVCETFGILEAERLAVGLDLVALRAQPLGPELERVGRAHPPDDGVHHPVAGLAEPRVRVLEEGDVGARVPLLVRVEEVVDGRIVLVHGLLHEPEPENAGVEVEVPGRVGRDARHVVDAVEPHVASSSSFAAARSDSCTRISWAPAAMKSSSGVSMASVSRYPHSIPADRSSPHTTSASD